SRGRIPGKGERPQRWRRWPGGMRASTASAGASSWDPRRTCAGPPDKAGTATYNWYAMLKDFKAFVMRGNVLDLAVAVVIGAAFGKIVTSLTDDLIMPIVGKVTGGLDFASHFVILGTVPADFKGSITSYADLKTAGVSVLGYGQFITTIVNF